MDQEILLWLNQWNVALDGLLNLFLKPHFRTVPFFAAIWALWFWPKTSHARTEIREKLTAAMLTAFPVILITRLVANIAPFQTRPIHTDGVNLVLQKGQDMTALDGWNSFPSDHASIFFGIATAIFLIHRGAGMFLGLWAIFIVAVPRIIIGYHWPSDIVIGAALGIAITVFLLKPLLKLVKKLGLIPFLEARETLAYPVLFVVTFEMASMFDLTRHFVAHLIR